MVSSAWLVLFDFFNSWPLIIKEDFFVLMFDLQFVRDVIKSGEALRCYLDSKAHWCMVQADSASQERHVTLLDPLDFRPHVSARVWADVSLIFQFGNLTCFLKVLNFFGLPVQCWFNFDKNIL